MGQLPHITYCSLTLKISILQSMATTIVNVLELDATGIPLAGYIIVDLSAPISDTATGSTWLPTPGKVNLVDGMATLNLLPSTDTNTNYHFEIWQYNPAPATDASLVYEFDAAVPLSPTPISLRTLLQQTSVVQDATDASIAAVVRELYYSNTFWTTLKQNFYPNRGTWNSVAVYNYGDVAYYQGNLYSSISLSPQFGNYPPAPGVASTVWSIFTQQGATGSGTSGDNTAYDATAWNDPTLGLKAPSKIAVRGIVEQLARTSQLSNYAPLSSPNLVAPTISTPPALTDRTSLIPSTNWVQQLLDVLRLSVTPVGLLSPYAGSAAPSYWLLCDGRTVSTTTYSALYGVISTTYNTGGESAGTFRIPDLRGRVPVGLDNMSGVMGAASVVPALTALGSKGGETNHVLTLAEMPSHTHSILTFNASPAAGTGSAVYGWSGTSGVTGSAGSGASHNNLQPYNGLNYIIFAGA